MGRLLVIALLGGIGGAALAQDSGICGSLENAFGPFDYRSARPEDIHVVERHHFDGNVASLRKGITGALGGDIDYTLRAFPNHPRALMAMINLGEKEKTERPRQANYSVYCYMERAVRWRPDDATVRMLFGIYLVKKGKKVEALEQLRTAYDLAGDVPNLNYNLGLVYCDLGDYDKALESAHKAYAGGFALPGLRKKLEKAGKWKPMPPPAPTQADSDKAPESAEQPANPPAPTN